MHVTHCRENGQALPLHYVVEASSVYVVVPSRPLMSDLDVMPCQYHAIGLINVNALLLICLSVHLQLPLTIGDHRPL